MTAPDTILWTRPIRQAVAALVAQGETPMDAVAMAVDAGLEARRRARAREENTNE